MKKTILLSAALCVLTLLSTAYALQPAKMQSENADAVPETENILGELSESIESSRLLEIIHALQALLKSSGDMDDETLRAEIRRVAAEYDVTLTEKQTDKLLALCRNIDRINTDTLKEKAGLVKKKVKDLTDGGQSASGFWQSAKSFFRNAFGFVSRLFKKYA